MKANGWKKKKLLRKRIFSGILALSMIVGSWPMAETGTVQAAVSNQNLLARYELLEDVKDDSGNGYDGTIHGNVSFGTGDAAGMILPGNSVIQNYVELPGEIFVEQDYLTISAWINSNVEKDNYSAIFFGTEAQSNKTPLNYWLFNPYSPQGCFKTAFTNGNDTNAPYNTEVLLNNTDTTQYKGVWAHYTTVITPTSLVGYINGQQIGSVPKTKTVSDFGQNLYAYLGRSNYLSDKDFAGSYQDVCIYNTVLDAAQIQELMGEAPAANTQAVVMDLAVDSFDVKELDGATGITSDIKLPSTAGYGTKVTWTSDKPDVISTSGKVTQAATQQTVTLTATITLGALTETKTFTGIVPAADGELYLHYDFSQVNGTTVTDLSGNDFHGTISGNNYSISEDVLTLPGGASGSDAAYVQIPTGTFDDQNTLTISLWLKNETGAGNYAAMFFGTTESYPTGYWLLNPCNPNGYYKSVITNAYDANAPYNKEYGISPTVGSQGIQGPATDDEWAMYTTVITPKSITAYYNNMFVGTVATSRTVSDFGDELVAYIGRSSYGDKFYKGGVRDVRVYTYGLDRTAIVDLYYDGLGDADAEAAALQEDADTLMLPYYYITEDLSLPTEGKNGSKITWSSDSTYIDENGTVIRPDAGAGDQEVQLTATLTLGDSGVTKTFSLVVLADAAASVLVSYMDELLITSAKITDDITLPTVLENGVTVSWSSSDEGTLTADGVVTRPEHGSGDKEVILTAQITDQGVVTTKTFSVIVAEKAYGNILTYVRSGDTDRTDALHIGYSEDDGQTYQALFNNQPILYPSQGSKKMGSPMYFHKADGTYGMISDDNHASGYVFIYDSNDLLTFTNPRYVRLDASGNFVSNPDCVYVENKGAYAIRYNGSDGMSYVVYTNDFETFTDPIQTVYTKASVQAAVPTGAIEAGVFEATKEEYDAILRKYSRVVNTSLSGYDTVTVSTGTNKDTIEKPERITAGYSDGSEKTFGVTWDATDWAAVDTNTPGTYEVSGTITQPEYGNILIPQRADPYVVQAQDGSYYFTASYPVCGTAERDAGIGYDRIILRHADTVLGLKDAEEITIWNANDSNNAHRYIWAPEMHYIGGSWYILFTASRSSNSVWDIRPHMLKCMGDDPMVVSNWETADESNLHQVRPYGNDNSFVDFSLDMTYFESAGRHYVAWAEKPNNISKIFLAEIDPAEPWQLISEHIVVSEPDFAWEWSGGTIINEGPAVLKNNGKIHLCFSGAAVDYTYCVGMMTADEGADLLDLDSWTKHPVALLKSEDFEVEGYDPQCGPGHNSFTYDENGNPMIVYHARPMNCSNAMDANGNWGSCEYLGPGEDALSDPCRHARAKSLNFAYDGTPILNMTRTEELSTTEVTWKIVVEGEPIAPTEFYAEKGVSTTLPAENAAEIISVSEHAVCTVGEDGKSLTFESSISQDAEVVYKQENGTTVTYVIHVYATENKTYVLDYGLTVDLNAVGNDSFGLYRMSDLTTYGMTGRELPKEGASPVAVFSGFRVSGTDAAYQTTVETEAAKLECTGDALYYTPTAFMESAVVYDYQVEVKQTKDQVISSAKDGVVLDAALTIVPAAIVYYEDDFSAITYTGTKDVIGTAADLIQSNDQDGNYGFDDVYGAQSAIDEDMILHYDFAYIDEATDGTVIPDMSGHDHDAVIRQSNATVSGDVLTLPGGANNSDAAYVELPTEPFAGKEQITISLWLESELEKTNHAALYVAEKVDATAWPEHYWFFAAADGAGNLKSVITNGGFPVDEGISPTYAGDGKGTTGPATNKNWTLFTTVFDGNKMSVYMNGELAGEHTAECGMNSFEGTLEAYIGKSQFSHCNTDPYYQGSIRDVRVYDAALSEDRVLELYEETKTDGNLLLHYDFSQVATTEEGVAVEGTVVQDLSGNNNNATVYGENVTVTGDVLNLPGTEPNTAPYLQLPNSLAKGKDAMTVSMWLESDRDDWFNSVFYLGNAEATTFWMLNPRCWNNVRAIANKSGGADNVLTPEDMTVTGEWALHTMVLETNKLSFYLDGEKYGERATDVSLSDYWDASLAYIGNSGFGGDFYNGNIRDVRIYDRALDAKEIALLYDADDAPTIDSAGSCTRLEAASGDARGTMTFTFKGTGFDLIGRSTSETAGLSIVVKDGDDNLVHSQILDTAYANGALYQLPLINVSDLAYDTYTVTIRSMKTETSNLVFIDAVRIYDPAGVDNDLTALYQEKERQTDIANVRELLLGEVQFADVSESVGVPNEDTTVPSGGSSVSLVSYELASDELAIYHGTHAQIEGTNGDISSGEFSTLEDILKKGPNNEVYLTKQNAIAFRAKPIQGASAKTLQIEAKKAADDGYAYAQISMITNRTDVAMQVYDISSYTPMYYEIDPERCVTYEDGSYLVIIASGTDSVVSLSNLKVAGYQLEALADTDYEDAGQVIADTYQMIKTYMWGDRQAEEPLPFVDVEADSWYEDSVRYVFDTEIMTGVDETHFAPYAHLSRAQFALMIYRMEGMPAVDGVSAFEDIIGDEWYGQAVLWAAEAGIVKGYADGRFGPADEITREQMAVMMYRYACYISQCEAHPFKDIGTIKDLGCDTGETYSFETYVDGDQVSDFAADAMEWAVANEIINGKENGTVLDPQGSTARGEAAVILVRYLK